MMLPKYLEVYTKTKVSMKGHRKGVGNRVQSDCEQSNVAKTDIISKWGFWIDIIYMERGFMNGK